MKENVYVSGYDEALKVTPESAELLGNISKWTRFLSVLGFVILIIMALGVLCFSGLIIPVNYYEVQQEYMSYNPGMMSWPYVVVYLLFLVVYAIPVYYLYKFSGKMKNALKTDNTVVFTDAMRFLNKHYTFIGILTIVWLMLMVFCMVMMLLRSEGSAMWP